MGNWREAVMRGGEGLKARVRMQVLWALDRPQRRERLSAVLRKATREDEEDGLADLRRLVEGAAATELAPVGTRGR